MIINCTQHNATPSQIEAGVVDLTVDEHKIIKNLLTFEIIPTKQDLITRAGIICDWLNRWYYIEDNEYQIMIGGFLPLMPHLERAIRDMNCQPVYSFFRRESVDEHLPDGSVVKRTVFNHIGFVEA